MWQVVRYGESMLGLVEKCVPAWKNSAASKESKKLISIFTRRHTLLQRKKSSTRKSSNMPKVKNQRQPRKQQRDDILEAHPDEPLGAVRKSTRPKKKRNIYLQSQWLSQFTTQSVSRQFGKKQK